MFETEESKMEALYLFSFDDGAGREKEKDKIIPKMQSLFIISFYFHENIISSRGKINNYRRPTKNALRLRECR